MVMPTVMPTGTRIATAAIDTSGSPRQARARRRGGQRGSRRAAVRGFGSDVPAFMRLRPRVTPAARGEGDSEA